MADISRLSQLLAGVQRGVSLANNDLLVDNVKIKAGSGSDAVYATFSSSLTEVRTISIPDANVDLANIAALVTLSGVAANDTHLGEFTGDTIPDNQNIKQALQALETAVESAAGASVFADNTFRIQDNGDSTKQLAFQVEGITTETTRTIHMPDSDIYLADIPANTLDIVDLVTLSGVAANAEDLGSFNGDLLSDELTIKEAFQEVEDELENLDEKIDTMILGAFPKGSVLVATSTNISFISAQDQAPLDTPFEIDDEELSTGDRVLVKSQNDPTENGVYVVAEDDGDYILERAEDFDGQPNHEVKGGDWVYVEEGDELGGTSWVVLGQGVKDVGNDPINWTKINKVTPVQAGAAIDVSGDTVSVKFDDQTIEVSSDALRVKADGINETHILLQNDQFLKARNDADDADVNILKVNDDDEVEMASFFVTPEAAPSEDYQVPNKKYVDDSIDNAVGAINSESLVRIADLGEDITTSGVKALRWAKASDNGYTPGRLYLADIDAEDFDNFYVAGLYLASGDEEAADEITIVKKGKLTAPSHGFTVGQPIFLDEDGELSIGAPSDDETAVVRVGIAEDANTIDVDIQVVGVN